MELLKLKLNPNNPQKFSDLSKLENSIKEFPKMMELRPLIYDPVTMFVLGGNKRLLCLKKLGYKEVPDKWVKKATDLTEEEKSRFIIADNVQYGEWDEFELKGKWDIDKLNEWGLSLSVSTLSKKQTINVNPYEKTHILLSFHPSKFNDVINLIEKAFNSDFIEIEQSSN